MRKESVYNVGNDYPQFARSCYNVGNDYPQFAISYYNPTPTPPEPTPPEPRPPEPIQVSGRFIYVENGVSGRLVDDQGNTFVYKEYLSH